MDCMNTQANAPRTVERIVNGHPTSDGAGVKLVRVLTQDLQQRLDPFLMLDAFGTDNPDDYIAGFPEHPHRGFETITYMLHGNMKHRDSRGNEGLLGPGSVQWMTAGRGILHSEMPEQVDGRMEGFQLWLNLPAARKMIEPAYNDIDPADIPALNLPQGVRVKVIAGEFVSADQSVRLNGAIKRDDTEPLFLDFKFEQSAHIECEIPTGHNAFIYACDGNFALGDDKHALPAKKMAILSDGARLSINGETGSHAILIAGKPLNEPIAQHGPFVMNTREELIQAVQDLQAGQLG